MLADDIRWRQLLFSLTVFLFDHFFQLFFVPVFHFIFLAIALIKIQTLLLTFAFDCQIMREFALITFATLAGLEEGT